MDLSWLMKLAAEAESVCCGSPTTSACNKVKGWDQHLFT